MAVYTQLEFAEIAALIAPLGLGPLKVAQGVAAGVENTTYFLTLDGDPRHSIGQEYVLTIAESLAAPDLEFIALLMRELSVRDLPVPAPIACGDRAALTVRNKPTLLVPKIPGTHPQAVSPDLCLRIGELVARLHTATLELGYRHESHRSLGWVETTAKALLPLLIESDRSLLVQEMERLSRFVNTNSSLPQAVIHGDLFRDNVLVHDGSIAGLIDFFSAGTGYLLFDLAVVVNDWCFDTNTDLNRANYQALIEGYKRYRKPLGEEIESWNPMLRIAALRFWVSRLNERLIASAYGSIGRGKDPVQYRRLLDVHCNHDLMRL